MNRVRNGGSRSTTNAAIKITIKITHDVARLLVLKFVPPLVILDLFKILMYYVHQFLRDVALFAWQC